MRYKLRHELENEFYQWRAFACALAFLLFVSAAGNIILLLRSLL